MPRPSKGPLKRTAMNLPLDLWKALRMIAAEEDTDVTALVEQAAREYLDRHAKSQRTKTKRNR